MGCAKEYQFVVATLLDGSQSILVAKCVLPAGHQGPCLVEHPESGHMLEITHSRSQNPPQDDNGS